MSAAADMSDVRAVVMALNASSAPGARFLSGCMAAARPRYLRRQAHELVGMSVDGGWVVGYTRNSSAAKNPLGDDVRSPSARVFREQGNKK